MKEFETITQSEIENGFINHEVVEYEDSIKDLSDLSKDELDCLIEVTSY